MAIKYTPEDHNRWLNTLLLEAQDKLSEWEINFLDSIERQLNLKVRMSEAQESKLEQLYAKYTN